jgi:hypothetical protein
MPEVCRLDRRVDQLHVRDLRRQDPRTATLGSSSDIVVNTQNEGWLVVARVQKTKIMVHEMFHVLQSVNGWPTVQGGWGHESSAEYVGDSAIIDAGMATSAEFKRAKPATNTVAVAIKRHRSSRYLLA